MSSPLIVIMCIAALTLLSFVCHAAIGAGSDDVRATSHAISVAASGDDTASIPDFDGGVLALILGRGSRFETTQTSRCNRTSRPSDIFRIGFRADPCRHCSPRRRSRDKISGSYVELRLFIHLCGVRDDRADALGRRVASGVYIYRIQGAVSPRPIGCSC